MYYGSWIWNASICFRKCCYSVVVLFVVMIWNDSGPTQTRMWVTRMRRARRSLRLLRRETPLRKKRWSRQGPHCQRLLRELIRSWTFPHTDLTVLSSWTLFWPHKFDCCLSILKLNFSLRSCRTCARWVRTECWRTQQTFSSNTTWLMVIKLVKCRL